MTGGGWGGAVVSLVPVSKLDDFLTAIKQKYPAYQSLDPAALGKAVFATAPGCGAGGTLGCLESYHADSQFSEWLIGQDDTRITFLADCYTPVDIFFSNIMHDTSDIHALNTLLGHKSLAHEERPRIIGFGFRVDRPEFQRSRSTESEV